MGLAMSLAFIGGIAATTIKSSIEYGQNKKSLNDSLAEVRKRTDEFKDQYTQLIGQISFTKQEYDNAIDKSVEAINTAINRLNIIKKDFAKKYQTTQIIGAIIILAVLGYFLIRMFRKH